MFKIFFDCVIIIFNINNCFFIINNIISIVLFISFIYVNIACTTLYFVMICFIIYSTCIRNYWYVIYSLLIDDSFSIIVIFRSIGTCRFSMHQLNRLQSSRVPESVQHEGLTLNILERLPPPWTYTAQRLIHDCLVHRILLQVTKDHTKVPIYKAYNTFISRLITLDHDWEAFLIGWIGDKISDGLEREKHSRSISLHTVKVNLLTNSHSITSCSSKIHNNFLVILVRHSSMTSRKFSTA